MTNIEKLIKESGKKLTQISAETGIAYPTLSGYNQGIRTPKKENAKILADYFGVSVPYLLGLDDNPNLINPGSTKEILKGFSKILRGQSTIENKITEWTPFGDELAVLLAEINQSEQLADYIDFMVNKKDFNPVLVKAIKQFISDKGEGLLPLLINKSSAKNSPYHYVWEAWKNSDEYKRLIAGKNKK
ncbi:helix-turn-helix domain-containing protein [Streptococcus mutans]|uniref:helix-turn-helix domain-containing protein n=1 Tax=Streptococcus mutans TaxID=1309 RepID=UPI0002B53ABF|nr:helix-turn-helix transcriptional regulator [Streptococcus mutans]EMC15504.1 DNA-binding protein [Streptococcus mutans NV1996]MCB4991371.1 helix-turn-helix domain-containing protein [Streptococcus mutans]MCB5004873.1 helix-turn-helix domain-containing protein [Streptococcus mutans]MCB5109092.1 helix-turn-helix domain-containing protein [Streptococcus mutans]QFG45449.1 helix-turn-helix family protein [Streptococcus mutans]